MLRNATRMPTPMVARRWASAGRPVASARIGRNRARNRSSKVLTARTMVSAFSQTRRVLHAGRVSRLLAAGVENEKLLVYRDVIPRRELIQYLVTLFSFHAALYCLRSFSLILKVVETKKY